MKVLIADDDPIFRRLLDQQVRGWGYEVFLVQDGLQAWDALQREPTSRIAILDWQMPGMDGIDVCRRLRSSIELPFTYTIMLTTRDTKEDMVTGLEAGADDYLAKPVYPKILRSRLAVATRIVEAVPPREWSLPRIRGYEVVRLLGRGMCGTVWEARQQETGRSVALKIIRRDLVTAEATSRFAREIQIAGALDHPNVARVYSSCCDQTICGYAMELIDGQDLGKYVAEYKPLLPDLLRILIKVCSGIEHAHRLGVVHRDLKPGNILVTRNGEPKVVDFGLAKSALKSVPEDGAHTLQDIAVGTPMFMAPEQARGENDRVDARSDVYALGVILYLILVRHHPHKLNRASRWEIVRSIADGEVRKPSLFQPDINPALESIVLTALSRNPDDRYATAGKFAEALLHFLPAG